MADIPTFGPQPDSDDAPAGTMIDMEECEDIALAAMQGLLASGAYKDNLAAAAVAAWQEVVPAYLIARDAFPAFLQKIYGTPEA